MRKLIITVGLFLGMAWCSSAAAWWDAGHMRVAAIAWENLKPAAKAEASRLLKLNPQYAEWARAVPANGDGTPGDVDRYAFIRASVWADDIKGYKDYTRTGDTADGPHAADNIGYADKFVHDYWHYKDIPFATDGSIWPAQDSVNAETQMKLFIAALPKTAGKTGRPLIRSELASASGGRRPPAAPLDGLFQQGADQEMDRPRQTRSRRQGWQ